MVESERERERTREERVLKSGRFLAWDYTGAVRGL